MATAKTDLALRRCAHFKAEAVRATTGEQLPDGRWKFSTRYYCPSCNQYFTESHVQELRR